MIDAEEVISHSRNSPDAVPVHLLVQARFYKGTSHGWDMEFAEHLELLRNRLTFGPRLAALPVLAAFGSAIGSQFPDLLVAGDSTGYDTGVLLLGSIALFTIPFLHLLKARPTVAWAGTILGTFLVLQLTREFIVGSLIALPVLFLILIGFVYSSWKLMSEYSRS